MVSGDSSPEKIEKLRKQGMVDYLTKPFDVPQFLQGVDDVLSGGGGKLRFAMEHRTFRATRRRFENLQRAGRRG